MDRNSPALTRSACSEHGGGSGADPVLHGEQLDIVLPYRHRAQACPENQLNFTPLFVQIFPYVSCTLQGDCCRG